MTAAPNRWRENAALFEAELREGRRWQEWAAAELRLHLGLEPELPVFELRRSIADADRFTVDDDDIVLRGTAVGDVVLEVKSRPVYFVDPAGYPYTSALIDTVSGWDAKRVEPRAVLLVSRTAQRMLVAPSATRPRWSVMRAHDSVRNTWDDFYHCPRGLLQTFPWLVNKLRP